MLAVRDRQGINVFFLPRPYSSLDASNTHSSTESPVPNPVTEILQSFVSYRALKNACVPCPFSEEGHFAVISSGISNPATVGLIFEKCPKQLCFGGGPHPHRIQLSPVAMADAMSRILGTPDHVFSTYYSDNRLCELRKETGKRLHQALDHQGRGDTVFIVPRTPLKRKNRQATGTTPAAPPSTQDKRKSETKKDVVVYFYVQSGKPPKELRLEGRTSKDGDTIYLQWEQNQAVLKKFKEDNDLGPRERLDVWDDTEDAWSPKKTRDKILLLPGEGRVYKPRYLPADKLYAFEKYKNLARPPAQRRSITLPISPTTVRPSTPLAASSSQTRASAVMGGRRAPNAVASSSRLVDPLHTPRKPAPGDSRELPIELSSESEAELVPSGSDTDSVMTISDTDSEIFWLPTSAAELIESTSPKKKARIS